MGVLCFLAIKVINTLRQGGGGGGGYLVNGARFRIIAARAVFLQRTCKEAENTQQTEETE